MDLYTLVIEELITRIHDNLDIQGFKIPEIIPQLETDNKIEGEVYLFLFLNFSDFKTYSILLMN